MCFVANVTFLRDEMILDAVKNRLAGYAFLIEKYRLSAMRKKQGAPFCTEAG
jgi:hypothetical protein